MTVKSNAVSVVVVGGGAGQVSVQVSQPNGPGTAPVWQISGLTPGGGFTVSEQVASVGPAGGHVFFSDVFDYTADSSGSDTRAFDVDGGDAGNVVGLMVTDSTTGAVGGTTYTLQ